jgi:hypothetical protein
MSEERFTVGVFKVDLSRAGGCNVEEMEVLQEESKGGKHAVAFGTERSWFSPGGWAAAFPVGGGV